MSRNWLNFVVDLVTALAALNLVFTGLLIYLVMPPGSGHGRLTLLGADRHTWGDVHFWTAVVVLGLVVLHVALHWQWVCTMACRIAPGGRRGSPNARRRQIAGAMAVLAVVAIVGGALWAASAAVQDHDVRPRVHERQPPQADDESHQTHEGERLRRRRGWRRDSVE